jgi:hypothetical protein
MKQTNSPLHNARQSGASHAGPAMLSALRAQPALARTHNLVPAVCITYSQHETNKFTSSQS